MYDVRDNQSVFVFGFRTQVCSPARPHQGLASGCSRCQASMHYHEPLKVQMGSTERLCFHAVWGRQVYRLWPYL